MQIDVNSELTRPDLPTPTSKFEKKFLPKCPELICNAGYKIWPWSVRLNINPESTCTYLPHSKGQKWCKKRPMTLKLAILIEAEVELGLSNRTLIYELQPLICKTHNSKLQIWSLTTPVAHALICRGSKLLVARDAYGSNCSWSPMKKGEIE